MGESKPKRTAFYRTGDMKGIGRREVFEMIVEFANEYGDDWDVEKSDVILSSMEYELEKMDAANAKRGSSSGGAKKDRMESDYMIDVMGYLRKLATNTAQTPEWFVEQFEANGFELDDGKKFALITVRQALAHMSNTGELIREQVVAETVGKDGLKSQRKKNGYRK